MNKIVKTHELQYHNENYTSKVSNITTNTIMKVGYITNLTHNYDYEVLLQEWYDYTAQIEDVLKLVRLSILSRCNISAILGDITGTHETFDYYLHKYQPFTKNRDSWIQDMMTCYPPILGALTLFIKTVAQNYNDAHNQIPIETEVYECDYNGQTAEDYTSNTDATI